MLELMKKPLTKTIHEAHFIGSVKKIRELVVMAKTLGLKETSDTVPWRDAFPDFKNEPGSAVALRGARLKEGLTQKELVELTGIPQGHISDMENGKRSIGKVRAKRLGEVLKISYKVFL